MAFVREVIPEEYWGMLKELGLYNEHTHLIPWVADKEREIYLWISRFADREDRTTDYTLIWQGQVIYINTSIFDNSSNPPIWDEEAHRLLKKGLIEKEINRIQIPASLREKKIAVIDVIKYVFRHTDYRFITVFRTIAEPEFY